jgi:hypothetical protein
MDGTTLDVTRTPGKIDIDSPIATYVDPILLRCVPWNPHAFQVIYLATLVERLQRCEKFVCGERGGSGEEGQGGNVRNPTVCTWNNAVLHQWVEGPN